MPPKVYFYRDDNGNIKKYAYCCICGAGPFVESERNHKYISLHGRSSNSYCLTCMKNLGIQDEGLIEKDENTITEKVEDYSFGEFSRSYIDPYIDITRKPLVTETQKPIEQKPPETVPVIEGTQKPVMVPVILPEEPGPFYVYIGQFSDDIFITGVTKDIKKDFELINSGINRNLKTLPMEIVYYHMEQNKTDAQKSKSDIMAMSPNQKEFLIENFSKKFFNK